MSRMPSGGAWKDLDSMSGGEALESVLLHPRLGRGSRRMKRDKCRGDFPGGFRDMEARISERLRRRKNDCTIRQCFERSARRQEESTLVARLDPGCIRPPSKSCVSRSYGTCTNITKSIASDGISVCCLRASSTEEKIRSLLQAVE